jgi:hypothetical protein
MHDEDRVPRDDVFIVRCWNEGAGLADARPVWRIQVRHLNQGDERYFDDPARLAAFIADRLSKAP